MAYGNNYGRWDNFSNSKLYEKYKHSQQPVMSAPSQQQQQPMDNSWNDLGNNIGKAWRESLARRNDGAYGDSIVGGTGNDAQNYANMQNTMSANDLGLQNNSFGTTDWSSLANNSNAIAMGEPIQLGAEIGSNALANGGAMAGEAVGSASTVAPELLANSLGASALEGGAMAGEAIGAGTAAATEAGASAGASAAGLGSVLGPLGIAAGIYGLGTMFDWW